MRNNDWVGKRNAARQNCQMRGDIRFLDGRPPMECTIVDISATGCRVKLAEEFDCPEDFDLFIPSRSETKIGKVRRQDGVFLGVAFLKSRLDDPLVMQTLLERVARLERGYSELKGFVAPATSGDNRGASELASPARDGFPAPVETGPLVEHRLKALAQGLDDIRAAVDRLSGGPLEAGPDASERPNSGAPKAPAVPASPGAETMAFAKMKADIAQLRAAVDEMTVGGADGGRAAIAREALADVARMKTEMAALGEAMRQLTSKAYADSPTYSADLAHMKAEMLQLGAAMRELAAEMPKIREVATATAASVAVVDPPRIAAMRADIAGLRALIESRGAGEAGGVVVTGDAAGWREEIEHVRAILSGEMAALRAAIAAIEAAPPGDAPAPRAAVLAADVAGVKAEMATLTETLRQVTNKAYADAPKFSADLAHMKAEMLKLSVSMRELSAELPKVQAVAQDAAAPHEHEEMHKVRKELEEIRTALESGAAGPGGDPRLQREVAALRDSLERSHAELRAAIDELDDAPVEGAAAPRATLLAADVVGIKTQMSALTETLRQVTDKAYSEAPKFSADLAHMKAEMLKLSVSMRELSIELPKVRAEVLDAAAPHAHAEIETVQSEIGRLWSALQTRPAVASTAGAEDAPLRHEVGALRDALERGLGELRAAIDELDMAAADGEAPRATMLAADVLGLKSEMTTLTESLRQVTARAYSEAPNFSADLAHMKAEMLKLSVSMRDMAQEIPKVQAVAASAAAPAADAAQMAKIRADIAQLRLAVETRAPRASDAPGPETAEEISRLRAELGEMRAAMNGAPAPAPKAASDDVADLRGSVQALILLVSQAFAARDIAA